MHLERLITVVWIADVQYIAGCQPVECFSRAMLQYAHNARCCAVRFAIRINFEFRFIASLIYTRIESVRQLFVYSVFEICA